MKGNRIARIGLIALASASLASPASAQEGRFFRGIEVMPGGVIAGDRILYEEAGVIVVPNGVGTQSFDSCPVGNVCLFANVSWTGNMVTFSSCCGWNNLSAFGFDNTASSWRNRLSVDAQLAKDPGGGGAKLCLNNGSFAGSMPAGWDNSASSIRVRDAGSYC